MKRVLAAVLALAVPTSSFASSFKILGSRPMSMGGAHVAVAEGGAAQYWNPGALAITPGSGVQIPIGVYVESTGSLLQKADTLSNISDDIDSIQAKQESGASISLKEVEAFNKAVLNLNSLNEVGTGALVGVAGGVDARVSRIAVSVNNFTEAGLQPFVDTKFNLSQSVDAGGINLSGTASLDNSADVAARDQVANIVTNMTTNFGLELPSGVTATTAANKLINDARGTGLTTEQIAGIASNAQAINDQLLAAGVTGGGTSSSFSSNDSNIVLRGASLTEMALGYGYPLPIPDRFGMLGLGGNAKIIRGDIGYARVDILNGDDTSMDKALDDLKDHYKTSNRFAADLGLLWQGPWSHKLQLGVVSRNVNSPTFKQADNAIGEPDYKESAQSRAGIAFWPWKRLLLAADLDLSNNKTNVPGFYSRYFGAGAEFNWLIFAFRGGVMRNLAEGTPIIYTGGLGLNVWALKVDLGAAMSSERVHVNDSGEAIPSNLQVGINIGLIFGSNGKGPGKSHKKERAPVAEVAPAAVVTPVQPPPVAAAPVVEPVKEPVASSAASYNELNDLLKK